MLLPTITAMLLGATLSHITLALPISQNQRLAIHTPYWHQGPQNYVPQDLNQKQHGCVLEPCDDKLYLQARDDYGNSIPFVKNSKRNKNSYRTGWTMGGMPFSVLYMNPKPQISVRSPMIAESLRSLPPNYENAELPPPAAENRVEDEVPEIQAEALQQPRFSFDHPSPTIMPTRKQYSIIPQLFVSYGWGPLGK